MDCSGWNCWILLHVLISLPAIGLMCCTSATTRSTVMCDSLKPKGSCEGRCGHWYNATESCQCNKACVKRRFNDCCNDYGDLCGATCEGRCGNGYDHDLPCQCNDKCQDQDNCCEDYMEICLMIKDTQPAHVCYITTYADSEDELLTNDTLWTCVTDGVTSLHWSRHCKFPIDSMDIVVNLTRGVTTEIYCSLVSTSPPAPHTYKWRMEAPTQSKIILRVHHSDEENDMTVIDSNSTHIFPVNESLDNGNDFVSSSNTVIMAATFSGSAQSQDFIVRGWTLEDAGTCEGRCGPYNASKSCQCNKACIRKMDCCNDYRALCGATCKGRCDTGYEPHLYCQCNKRCQENKNCCKGYRKICLNEGSDNPLIPIVVVLSIIILIIGATLGVIRYKRRQSSLKPNGKQQRQSLDDRVIDSSMKTGTDDQNNLEEDSANPLQKSSRNATPVTPSRAGQLQENARTGLRVPGSSTGANMVIYNEVGEENYNVLFGGKEQGDYHTYSLPDSAQGVQMTSKEREGNSVNSGPVEQSEHDESRNGSTIANHSSDVLEREIKPILQAHASGHGCTNAATQSAQEPDYDTPKSKPKTTSDYEDPVKDLGAVHKPYDHLRHNTASKVPQKTTAVAVGNRTSLGAEENAVNTYQTLDSRQEERESGEYSYLQRPLDIKPSPDHPRILSSSNLFTDYYRTILGCAGGPLHRGFQQHSEHSDHIRESIKTASHFKSYQKVPVGTSNVPRLPSESILIFLLSEESNRNVLRMPSESLDSRSNAVGTSQHHRIAYKHGQLPLEL